MGKKRSQRRVRRVVAPTAIDLFAGCGGLTEGLMSAGFNVLAAVEVDGLAADTYTANHADVYLARKDIRLVRPPRLMRTLGLKPGELTLLAGCPPCQGFSSVRRRNRTGAVDDDRNDLVGQMLRFARALVPAAVMMENVPGLSSDARMGRLTGGLERLGYVCTEVVVDAADHGVPQRRKRLLLLAGQGRRLGAPAPTARRVTVRDAIAALSAPGGSGDPLHDLPERRSEAVSTLIRAVPKDGGSRRDVPGGDGLACHQDFDGFKDVYGRMAWDSVAPTITGGCVNPSKGRFLHPEADRAITLREAALLQGFRQDYAFSLKRGKFPAAAMVGNALPPPLAEAQARALLATLDLGDRS
jgi:DNA (cytosine-5)-methyltransferase 1